MTAFTNETIDLDQLPKYEETTLTRPDPKYWLLLVINTSIFLVMAGIGLFTLLILNNDMGTNWEVWSALYVVFGVILFFVLSASFKRRGFALREKDVLYKSGIIAATTTIVPLNRIQHVALNEGVLSRIFKLGTLQIYTAGGSSGQISIAGIPIEQAKVMKEALVQRLVVQSENR